VGQEYLILRIHLSERDGIFILPTLFHFLHLGFHNKTISFQSSVQTLS
jgi:hypothetical protein